MATENHANSQGMLPNGRAATAEVVQASVAKSLQNALSGPNNFDTKLIGIGVACIEQSVKEGANLTRRLFNLFRACKSIDQAKGTLMVAETQAIERANKHAQEQSLPPVRTLAQMAEANGMSSLSYVQIKSNIVKGWEKREDHAKVVQRLYDYKERLEKTPKMEVQKGWCDPFSERYSDEKFGSTMFMKDVRYSIAAVREVDRYAKQLQREAAARNEGARQNNERAGVDDSATNGANAGIRSGQNGADVIPDGIKASYSKFTQTLSDACKVLDVETVNTYLQVVLMELNSKILNKLAEEKDAKAKSALEAKVPAQVQVTTAEGLEGAENVEPPTISDEQIEDFNRPAWYTPERWAQFTEEEKASILDDPESDKDGDEYIAWSASQPLDPEEEQLIKEHGESLKDATG